MIDFILYGIENEKPLRYFTFTVMSQFWNLDKTLGYKSGDKSEI